MSALSRAVELYYQEIGFDRKTPKCPVRFDSDLAIDDFLASLRSHAAGFQNVRGVSFIAIYEGKGKCYVTIVVKSLRPVYSPNEDDGEKGWKAGQKYHPAPDWTGEGWLLGNRGFDPTPGSMPRVKFVLLQNQPNSGLSEGEIQFLDRQPRFT
jgi:hypothetical protein